MVSFLLSFFLFPKKKVSSFLISFFSFVLGVLKAKNEPWGSRGKKYVILIVNKSKARRYRQGKRRLFLMLDRELGALPCLAFAMPQCEAP